MLSQELKNRVEKVDVLIVGAGPAGMAAAIAAKEAGVDNLLVLEREANMGGILRQCIHNGFGLHRFKEELTGPEYAQRDIDKVKELGIEVRCGTTVLSIDENRFVTAVSKEKGVQLFEAGALILAMGCRERPRGALATPGTRCAGIYSAGTAQKFVNLEGYMPGKRVVILGSGDIGLIMARRMTLQGAKVLACVELMPYSSGLNRNIVQCLHDYDIPLLLSHTVIDIQGKERLTGVTVAEVDAKRQPIPGTEQHFDCDTLLLSVGLLPENELTRAGRRRDEQSDLRRGWWTTTLQTSKEPAFLPAATCCMFTIWWTIVSAESFKAGKAAAEYVQGKKRVGTYVSVKDGDGVRGVVPQKLLIPDGDAENVQIMFRPSGVYENAYIRVMDGEKELIKQKKRILTPGEMAELILKPEVVKGLSGADVTVSIVKE